MSMAWAAYGATPWGPYGFPSEKGADRKDAVEEQVRRHEEREKRLKEEEEERQQKAKEREKKLKEEEEERQREAKRLRAEEEKRQQEAREREKRQKEEEEENRRKAAQQHVAWAFVGIIAKLSQATPSTFEQLKEEIEQAIVKQLPHTGPQEESLKAEARKALELAAEQVDRMKERAKQEQENLQEQERVAKGLLETLEECGSGEAPPEFSSLEVMDDRWVLRTAAITEGTARAAISACSACADFLVEKRPTMDEVVSLRDQCRAKIAEVKQRLEAATRQAIEVLGKAIHNKQKVIRKMAAVELKKRRSAMFEKYDVDGDGLLSREEIIEYAGGAHGFDIPAENLDRICRQLIQPGSNGVDAADFHLLKTAVGIAREEARARWTRSQREAMAIDLLEWDQSEEPADGAPLLELQCMDLAAAEDAVAHDG